MNSLKSGFSKILLICTLIYLLLAIYLQLDMGLADNGDFTRIMTWFTSGPAGIEPNWPSVGEELRRSRFFFYYLPYWKLDFPFNLQTYSSVLLLWLPGIITNYLFYSQNVLYIPVLSIFPRVLLILLVLVIYYWIDRSELDRKQKWLLFIVIGLPSTLMLTTTDYLAYLNSLYQDIAGLVFSICILVSLVLLVRKGSWWTYLLIMALALLMATAKASTFYWPFLGVIGIALITLIPFTRKSILLLTLFLTVAVGISIIGLSVTRRGYNPKNNEYQSLFLGVLTLSSKPYQRLRELGMPQAINCVGINLYTRANCAKLLDKYPSSISFANSAKVIIREPMILPRMIKFLADRMQDISSPQLGKFVEGAADLRGGTSIWNLWSALKYRYFPKGIYLLITWTLYLVLFVINQRSQGIRKEMAVIGIVATLACAIDMGVAFLGEGRADLIKHLLLSNFMFDIATIMALGLIPLAIYRLIQNRAVHEAQIRET